MDTPKLITITLPDDDRSEHLIVAALTDEHSPIRRTNLHRTDHLVVVRPVTVVSPLMVSDHDNPIHATLRQWSPLRPFDGLCANYRLTRQALRRDGHLTVVYICLVAALAALLWRHDALLIGVAGGLLVSGILCVRTGAHREYLAAIEDLHSAPSLGTVIRYNAEDALKKVRSLCQRH